MSETEYDGPYGPRADGDLHGRVSMGLVGEPVAIPTGGAGTAEAALETAPIYSRAAGLRAQAANLREMLERIEANFHGTEPCPPDAKPAPPGPLNVWALLSQTEEALQLATESASRIGSMVGAP